VATRKQRAAARKNIKNAAPAAKSLLNGLKASSFHS
jgi:hypothetical protein